MNLQNQNLALACVGNANDPNTFGGLPYHLLKSGQENGLIEKGLSFRTSDKRIKLAKYFWNSLQYMKTGKFGGFQYSEPFLNLLWASDPGKRSLSPVLNLFQLFPEREMTYGYRKFFYLDQTLKNVFEYYHTGNKMPASWLKEIILKEKKQYEMAEKVVFRSQWAANSAKLAYGLSDDKVEVVLPGANISKSALFHFDNQDYVFNTEQHELKLVFVGKEWRRKGLDRLLTSMQLAKREGAKISLTVIGVQPEKILLEKYAKGLSVQWVGFIDKSKNPSSFTQLIAQHDLGVLLSRSEAGGVSLREFGRLGLPVIAPNTGGSPEFAMSDSAIFFTPEADNEEIAEALINLSNNRRLLNEMKHSAWSRRHVFDWGVAVEELSQKL